MKTYTLEKMYQGDVTRWFRGHGAFTYKIGDVGLGYKPFDCFSVYKNVPYYLELKLERTAKNKWNTNKIEPHQITNLLLIKENMPSARAEVWLWWNGVGEFRFPIIDLVDKIAKDGTSLDRRDEWINQFKIKL